MANRITGKAPRGLALFIKVAGGKPRTGNTSTDTEKADE
jgi:hypothetical protein